jgi:hypothetical protein
MLQTDKSNRFQSKFDLKKFLCEFVFLDYHRYKCSNAVAIAVAATFVATTGRYVRPQRAPLTQEEQDREDVGAEKLTKLSEAFLHFD